MVQVETTQHTDQQTEEILIPLQQPSQNVSEDRVILKLEAVWLPKATFRASVGHEHVGRVWGHVGGHVVWGHVRGST